MKVMNDHRSKFSNLSSGKEKPEKYQGFNGIRTHDLIAQLVEHRTGIAEVMGSNPVEALIFFSGFSFQLLKLENLLRWSFITFI